MNADRLLEEIQAYKGIIKAMEKALNRYGTRCLSCGASDCYRCFNGENWEFDTEKFKTEVK